MTNASIEAIRRATTFAACVLAVAAMYWLRELLIPLAVAILVVFLLNPLVTRLLKWRVPRTVAVLLATGLSAAVVVGMLYLLSSQVVDLTSKLPNYQQNLTEKTKSIRHAIDGKLGKFTGTIQNFKTEFASTTQPKGPTGLQLEVKSAAAQESGIDFMTIATAVVDPILTPITQTGIVFILVLFLLLDLDVVSRRLQWLSEHLRLGVPVDVVDEAFTKVARYLRVQLAINVSYGVLIATALWTIGVPNALLWGVLSAVLRYVPFIGPWIAASLPIALSVAIFPGWGKTAVVVAAFLGIEAVTNGLLEPMLYGQSTGVSTIGVVIATFFWGWLWGPVGLILAMPITTCLVVIGRHIPLLRTLSVMLSSDAIDSPAATITPDPSKPVDVTSFILKMR